MRTVIVAIAVLWAAASFSVAQPLSFTPDRVTHADTSTASLEVDKDAVVLSYNWAFAIQGIKISWLVFSASNR